MSTPAPAIWPIKPLLDATGLTLVTHFARRVKANGQTARRAYTKGLTDRQADQWAIRLGYHPGEIWPDWFDRLPHKDTP